MPQLEVKSSQQAAMAGLLDGVIPHDIRSYINNTPQKVEFTVAAADLATTATINGTAFTVNVAAAAKTKAELVALLIAAINAGVEPVTASDGSATDKMYVDADVAGTAFTYAGTTNCSVAVVVANEASVPFGVLCVQNNEGGNDNLCHLPQVTGDISNVGIALGISVHSQAIANALAPAANVGYAAGSAIGLLRKGRIWVICEDACTPGLPAFVRFTVTATDTQLGSFRTDADTGKAVALPGAYFRTTAAAGALALVEINLP